MAIVNNAIFVIIATLLFIFSCYINIVHYLDVYGSWFWGDVEHTQAYDYIVIGAGSAGAILAGKMANNGQRILLLEAGGRAPFFTDIPLLAPLLQGTPYDWQYRTVPQRDACKGLINNQSKWPMGKIFGGTSRLNYMAYVRGHVKDYDDWFPDYIDPTTEYGGPMHIENIKWHTEIADAILQAAKEIGQRVGNINKDMATGFMKAQLTMKNGKRWSSDETLHGRSIDTITIITHARVDKILMQSNKAVGVKYTKLSKTLEAFAKKGVVVCAGAIGTPKLLMLSGIGPEEHLESLNINVINNLPVGRHLVDHVLTGVDLVTLNTSLSLSSTVAFDPVSALNYFAFGKGAWTHAGMEILGTFHSPLQRNKLSAPDLQLMILPFGVSKDHGLVLKKAIGISDKVYDRYFASLTNQNVITIAPVLLHPKSSGEVKLRSADPADDPLIDPRYLSNREDVSSLVHGIRFVKRLIKTDAMKPFGPAFYKQKFPGCEDLMFDSMEYWECYIRHLTLTSYHPAGTCRMGEVVDSSFRVYNTENLYVVDASVLPRLPSGNINAAVIMLAEKAARLFKLRQQNKVYFTDECKRKNALCYVFNVCNNICNIK